MTQSPNFCKRSCWVLMVVWGVAHTLKNHCMSNGLVCQQRSAEQILRTISLSLWLLQNSLLCEHHLLYQNDFCFNCEQLHCLWTFYHCRKSYDLLGRSLKRKCPTCLCFITIDLVDRKNFTIFVFCSLQTPWWANRQNTSASQISHVLFTNP